MFGFEPVQLDVIKEIPARPINFIEEKTVEPVSVGLGEDEQFFELLRSSFFEAVSAIRKSRMISPSLRSAYWRRASSWMSSENPSRSCSRLLTRARATNRLSFPVM